VKRSGLALVLLSCFLTGCARTGPHSRPAELESLAAQFKAKAGTNRIAEGKKIAALLPTVPVTRKNWGFEESIDWGRPSYRLPEQEFFEMMGKPDLIGALPGASPPRRKLPPGWVPRPKWVEAEYFLGRDRKGNELGLFICASGDHVVMGWVAKTNASEYVVMRSGPKGSVIVETNHFP